MGEAQKTIRPQAVEIINRKMFLNFNRSDIIGGLFSIGAALIAFWGGIVVAIINNKKKERLEEIKELKNIVKQLATSIICYSKVEDNLVSQLKEWTQEPKKTIRAKYSKQLFGDENKSLMTARNATSILDKYSLENWQIKASND